MKSKRWFTLVNWYDRAEVGDLLSHEHTCANSNVSRSKGAGCFPSRLHDEWNESQSIQRVCPANPSELGTAKGNHEWS
jgi:hypothetical protein